MALRLYNTLTQQLETFKPLFGNTVRMYTCGPTVYNFVHIGNLRTFTFQDILRRWLRYRGFELNHVMNITDGKTKSSLTPQKRGNRSKNILRCSPRLSSKIRHFAAGTAGAHRQSH